MEDQHPCRSQRLQIIPSLIATNPPPPPQRQILITSGSFESTGVSESLRESELRYTHIGPLLVEIEYLQAEEFARKYNSPLTNLRDLVLLQACLFSSCGVGVPLSSSMSNSGEGSGDMSTPTSAMVASGVSPSPVSSP